MRGDLAGCKRGEAVWGPRGGARRPVGRRGRAPEDAAGIRCELAPHSSRSTAGPASQRSVCWSDGSAERTAGAGIRRFSGRGQDRDAGGRADQNCNPGRRRKPPGQQGGRAQVIDLETRRRRSVSLLRDPTRRAPEVSQEGNPAPVFARRCGRAFESRRERVGEAGVGVVARGECDLGHGPVGVHQVQRGALQAQTRDVLGGQLPDRVAEGVREARGRQARNVGHPLDVPGAVESLLDREHGRHDAGAREPGEEFRTVMGGHVTT